MRNNESSPFVLLDIENETLALPRNSNLWTMMYVGNNYQDNNLPSGNILTNIKKIIGSAAPTTSTIGDIGDIYIDTNNGVAYICMDVSSGSYTWTQITVNS